MKIYYGTAMVIEDPRLQNLGKTQYENEKWDAKNSVYNALFYLCSLVENMARLSFNCNSDVINIMGKKEIEIILEEAEALHNKEIVAMAGEMISRYGIKESNYSIENYDVVPSSYTIAEPISKLIFYIAEQDNISTSQAVINFYNSPIVKLINNYDIEMHLDNIPYLYESYKAKRALDY